MKKLFRILILLIIISSSKLFSQSFESADLGINLRGGYLGFASFVDYNNDNLLDIFVTGVDFENRFSNAVFYTNNGNNTYTESSITNIPRVIYGNYSWGDFDNNGTLDLLYAGTTSGSTSENITKIYRNNGDGCEFTEIPNTFPQLSRCSVNWVDIDNDNLLDIQVHGINNNNEFDLSIFKNNGDNTFTKINNSNIIKINGERGNLTVNNAEWVDFDNDGFTDVIIAMSTNTERQFSIYKNLGGFQFQRIDIELPQLSYIQMDIGDINNDNLEDIVFTGSPNLFNQSGDGTGDLYVYINNGNMNFSNIFTIVDEGVFVNDIELGDIDNDNFIDIINYGTGPFGTFSQITKIYKNNQDNTFSNFNHTLPNSRNGGIKFGDFDNDTDIDILYYGRFPNPSEFEATYVYENLLITNSIPDEIIYNETCSCNSEAVFSLNTYVDSITWNFGDIISDASNSSNEVNPTHVFSSGGYYTITATYIIDGVANTLSKNIYISSLPSINKPMDIEVCKNTTEIDLHNLLDYEILNNLSNTEYRVSYHQSFENADTNIWELNSPHTIETSNQTIFARVQSIKNPSCYSITNFEILIASPPQITPIDNIQTCDEDNDGFANFDTSNIESSIVNGQTGLIIEYYNGNGSILTSPLPNPLINSVKDIETITAKAINSITGCYTETTFNLIVSPSPVAHSLEPIFGCDDNNDGISEYFDTSLIEMNVLNEQERMEVTYYNQDGNLLPSPLPNPYTNNTPFFENIIVRVTNISNGCYNETSLVLETSSKPSINEPSDLYTCDEGDGFGNFNTSQIKEEIIGSQTGLQIFYFDDSGNILPSPLPTFFQNTSSYSQNINVRVENISNPACYSETSFNFIVNSFLEIDLQESYTICDLEPSINLSIDSGYDFYNWVFEDGSTISNSNEAEIILQGDYTLTVIKMENGITCENSFSFSLTRSELPEIQGVNHGEFGNNFIEIIASGDGNFEYSIDGVNYQDSNFFNDVRGGCYDVYIRDKDGCGIDSSEVVLLDYPKFFTPNNDGHNDYWQIKGVEKSVLISYIKIYDRYGKILKQLPTNSIGWDGTYNGQLLPSNDYWFTLEIDNRVISGHFTLKR